MVAGVIGLSGGWAAAQEYDGCNEQFYDSVEEECGGGHQHNSGKRDEVSLERSRHRHRYLEDQIKQLTQKVSALSAEVDQLKKAAAK
jgi:hypothetical protein